VRALADGVNKGDVNAVVALFGPGGHELVDSTDPPTARRNRNREVFSVAFSEGWRLVDEGATRKTLVIGNEGWPFPVPLVRAANGWRFDTAAGMEEIVTRRIGRNELAVIQTCRTYVEAQRVYAKHAHDEKPAGLYARTIRSDRGLHNGLYWPAVRGEKPSPLGDLVTTAEESTAGEQPSPFQGYYFRILTAQGASAPGGAKDYVVNGRMSEGFAMVAWPARYDVTGIMTFIVNHDGVVYEKDLGAAGSAAASSMTLYDPDSSWTTVP
jgi:hypothetical protein